MRLFKGFTQFVAKVYRQRFLIIQMATRDIAAQYIGSSLGFFWAFINPLAMIFILWVVFSVGFKATPRGDVPFIVWLTCGMAIWNTFSEVIVGATGVIRNNSHLVKKVVFPLSILPVTKLISAFVTHSIFLILLIILILLHDMPFNIYWLQSLYYFGALCVLALGLAWFFSSLNVFVNDTAQIVNIILQFGFWGTPIFWDINIMPDKIHFLIKLNPMYYIVQGYRESFIYFIPFWQHWRMTLYFWGIAFFILVAGALIFKRLRPHFSDVL